MPAALDETDATAYLLGRAAPYPSLCSGRNSRTAAGPFSPLVRGARMDAARASTRAAGKGPRRSFRALDRADRRRQDAGRILADAGGAFFSHPSFGAG